MINISKMGKSKYNSIFNTKKNIIYLDLLNSEIANSLIYILLARFNCY